MFAYFRTPDLQCLDQNESFVTDFFDKMGKSASKIGWITLTECPSLRLQLFVPRFQPLSEYLLWINFRRICGNVQYGAAPSAATQSAVSLKWREGSFWAGTCPMFLVIFNGYVLSNFSEGIDFEFASCSPYGFSWQMLLTLEGWWDSSTCFHLPSLMGHNSVHLSRLRDNGLTTAKQICLTMIWPHLKHCKLIE